MANCPYVDQEKSGPSNGWYCSIAGEAVGYDFHSNYCSSSVSCEHCPYCGGDDRLRNPDCLTEEICQSILSSTWNMVESLNRYLCESIIRIMEQATNTGYAYLLEMIRQYTNYWIYPPDISGQITALVLTEPERGRAQSLESGLEEIWSQVIQPGEYTARYPSDSLLPHLSSDTFRMIVSIASEYGDAAYAIATESEIDTGGIPKYESVVRDADRELGGEVNELFREICEGIYEAERVFENGCSSALSSAGTGRGYSADSVIWGRQAD